MVACPGDCDIEQPPFFLLMPRANRGLKLLPTVEQSLP